MNKRVLITGGAKGLGKEIAVLFAKNNYDVVITYKNSEIDASKMQKYLVENYDVSVDIYKMDICDEANIKELISKLNNLDVLINNAAYNNDCDIFEHTKEEFIKVLDTNLVGPFLLSKYAYPLLKESSGNIINIASTNGIDTMYKESLDYDASKAGLINLTKNLAVAFAPYVRVNAIAPGWIKTESTNDMNPKFVENELKHILLNRFAEKDEIAKVIYFIASDDASYINGSIIRVDGGYKND